MLSTWFALHHCAAYGVERTSNEQLHVAPPINGASQLPAALTAELTAQATAKSKPESKSGSSPITNALCLPEGGGFLRAKLTGTIKAELNWSNEGTDCSGATRPSGGVRMRFSHAFDKEGHQLVLVFGIPGLREGVDARELAVNLTLIREGAGQFFGTRGDDKCTIDRLHQEAIAGIPLRNRRYRITASGFCMKPARAIAGDGSILITRFDFVGRVDYSEEDKTPDDRTLAGATEAGK